MATNSIQSEVMSGNTHNITSIKGTRERLNDNRVPKSGLRSLVQVPEGAQRRARPVNRNAKFPILEFRD
jgi:hypothetical protein